MKKILLSLMILAAVSCSKDDNNCDELRAEINAEYDAQVEWVMENTNPIDYRQIGLINEERQKKLDKACD